MISNIPLLVLAGGFGTRLNSVLDKKPKSLAPIGSSIFLKELIKNWKKQGISIFIFLLHHEHTQILDFLNGNEAELFEGVNYDFVIEQEPLGTGGSIANAVKVKNISVPFFVANSDTWLTSAIPSLYRVGPNAISLTHVDDVGRYGAVTTNADGLVQAFNEKCNMDAGNQINAGTYFFEPSLFFGKQGSFSLETHTLFNLAASGKLKSAEALGQFHDIGVPEDYFNFVDLFLMNKVLYHES